LKVPLRFLEFVKQNNYEILPSQEKICIGTTELGAGKSCLHDIPVDFIITADEISATNHIYHTEKDLLEDFEEGDGGGYSGAGEV
jgi:hypothetical protein